jgi:ParB-like chromosome segregation protein Spo0J
MPAQAPGLEHLLVPAQDVKTHPANPRKGDVEGIATSLRRFGQVRPIVVQDSTGYIVAGNHTFRAATEVLGWGSIAAVRVPMTDEEARAYLVADNRWSDSAEWDDAALVAILQDLADTGGLEGTGYTADELDDLVALTGGLETEREAFEGGYAQQPEPVEREGTHGAGAMPMREVVLVMPAEQAEEFGRHVKRLSQAYESTGVAATVREAVRREAARLDA